MGRISNKNSFKTANSLMDMGGKLVPCKVKKVILDPGTSLAQSYGGHDAVGLIFYNKVRKKVGGFGINPDSKDKEENPSFDGFAKPLFPFLKYYPLINEVVTVITLTSKDYLDDRTSVTDYYFPPINLWNHPHHNTLPSVQNYQKDNSEIFKEEGYGYEGLVRRTIDGEVDLNIPLGKYFKEYLNIKPLLPFEGDHITEGRFGNTIRLGSTARGVSKDKETGAKEYKFPTGSLSPWSKGGASQNGDPIIIIRNGQPKESDSQGWVHTIEDINLDPSSIYMTSTQNIENFQVAADMCWYSFGNNVYIKQDSNKQAGKIVGDTSGVFDKEAGSSEVEGEETTTETTGSTLETTATGSESSSISEEEAGFERDESKEYYQLDDGQTELEIIERPPLNHSYRIATDGARYRQGTDGIINCGNCAHSEGNYCNKFGAKVRANHENPWICNTWKQPDPPTPPANNFPRPIRITDSDLKTENMARSYGEVSTRTSGFDTFVDVTFNLVGLSPSTISFEGTSNLYDASPEDILGDGISGLISRIGSTHNLYFKIESGPRWPSSKIEEIKSREEEKSQDKRTLLPLTTNKFIISSPSHQGTSGYIAQSFSDEDEYGNFKFQKIDVSIVGFGKQSSPNFKVEEDPHQIINTMMDGFVHSLIGEVKGTVKVTFDDNGLNTKLKNLSNNIIA